MGVAALGEQDAADDRFSPAVLAAANINPVTRLATDYLNHFNNVVMLLDLITQMPECADEVAQWRPTSYRDYFAGAHFRDRDLAIAAYAVADPAVRAAFDRTVEELDAEMLKAQEIVCGQDLADPATAHELGVLLGDKLRPLIARASGVVNGGLRMSVADGGDPDGAQHSVDELFP